jgi:hypothetical protein
MSSFTQQNKPPLSGQGEIGLPPHPTPGKKINKPPASEGGSKFRV